MSIPIVEVKNLGKKYRIGEIQSYLALRDKIAHPIRSLFYSQKTDVFWALHDVNFSVERGETVGIIGKNGAGKSTLLKILSQITPPTTGTITLRGKVGSLLEVGTGFHPELTGRENIYLNGAILGMKKNEIKEKMVEIIEFSGVEKFIDTPVKRYSSGMYVRLAFAVAAHLEPDILIVDEVLSVGDIEFQKKCLGKMKDITQKDGRTVFFVSHNTEAIKQLCKKSILLEHGKVLAYGLTDEVLKCYMRTNDKKLDNAEYYPAVSDSVDTPVKLISARLSNKEGFVLSGFGSTDDVYVSVEYEIKEEVSGFLVDFYIANEQNTIIFISSDNDRNQFTGKKRTPGRYRSICKIPGNLLNVGKYAVTIGGRVPNIKQFFIVRDALMMHIQSNGGPTSVESRESVIYPDLEWHTEAIK